MPGADGRQDGHNLLLGSLSRQGYARLEPKLREVVLKDKDLLYRAGEPQEWVYFPARGTLISLLAVTDQGASVEVAITGREGMIGVSAVLGAQRGHQDGLVQNPGVAWRMRIDHLRDAMGRDEDLRDLLLRYVNAVFIQVSQNVLCNRLHSVEERLARWMLVTEDRVEATDFHMTHELLAKMLGTRRTSVSLAAASLQRAGLLRYSRGHMSVLDREGLRKVACSCYDVMRTEMLALQKQYRG